MVIPHAQALMLKRDVSPENHMLIGAWACYGTYECADGKHLAVGALEPHFWKRFCELAGIDDEGAQYDKSRQDVLRARVAAVLRTRTRDDWVDHFGSEDVCAAPVLSIEEAVASPHVRARGSVTSVQHPSGAVLEAPRDLYASLNQNRH